MRILYQLTSPMHKTVGTAEVARRQSVLQANAAAGTEVIAEPTATGPAAIESAHDAGLVVPELIRLGPLAQQRGFEALIIGCYSDPGLDALRELLSIPVIGPGAASLHLAAQLGTRISVLTPSGRGYGRVAARLRALGLAPSWPACAASASPSWTSPNRPPARSTRRRKRPRWRYEQDGADVLVLGCMSMAFLPDITVKLGERVGVPIVNPVLAALKTAEALVTMRLSHSKQAWPPPKPQEIA